MAELTTEDVWESIEKEVFAVVGMVNARNEGRTVGIYYLVRDRRLWFATRTSEWKTKHMVANPNVSLTVAIPKRVPLMPFIKVPAATVTFSATATARAVDEVPTELFTKLSGGLESTDEAEDTTIFEITPKGHFVTYGVGVSLTEMRDTELARGRAPVE